MSYERIKIAQTSVQDFPNAINVFVVSGWDIRRDCGCSGLISIRLDKDEPVFGVLPCDEPGHSQACDVALRRMREMPPSDREIGELWEELLEEQLQSHPLAR